MSNQATCLLIVNRIHVDIAEHRFGSDWQWRGGVVDDAHAGWSHRMLVEVAARERPQEDLILPVRAAEDTEFRFGFQNRVVAIDKIIIRF